MARAKTLALPLLIAGALLLEGGLRSSFAQQDLGTKIKQIFEPTPPPKKRKTSSKKKASPHAVTIAERVSFRFPEEEIDGRVYAQPIAHEEKGKLGEEKSYSESDAGSVRNSDANELAFAASERQA
jgi:hypothetical protein